MESKVEKKKDIEELEDSEYNKENATFELKEWGVGI